jgi:hypothetical protein
MAACRLMVPDFRAGHSREVNPQVRATACRSARAVARQEAARCALSSAPARNQAGPHPRSSGRAGRPAGRRFLASPQPAYGRAWQACGASASLPGANRQPPRRHGRTGGRESRGHQSAARRRPGSASRQGPGNRNRRTGRDGVSGGAEAPYATTGTFVLILSGAGSIQHAVLSGNSNSVGCKRGGVVGYDS